MKTLFLFIFFFVLLLSTAGSQNLTEYLLPVPEKIVIHEGQLERQEGKIIINNFSKHLAKNLILTLNSFTQTNVKTSLISFKLISDYPLLNIETDNLLSEQAYTLSITKNNIHLTGGSAIGINYGLLTLQQIGLFAKEHDYWPCVEIYDEPDFERRGVMLDISRDKVPTMETLYMLIEKLASWKINEIQLYTEHTFAYKNHETVWKDASPMTSEQIRELDKFCHNHFIDLVPNQNSFGHMKQWLKHKEYEHLAELTKPGKTIWGMMSHTSLSPVEPGSLELMKELYTELLPNFTSRYFNIGCDETVELGVGKSKQLCQEKGKGRVYLDFVLSLKKEVDKHNRITQFWGDIILNHPELIPYLPKDMVALIWGYEANYPFERNCKKFQNAGLLYYVCPGTSTWKTIIGQNKNALGNIKNAAVNGKKYNATGFLNTNWGDYGHWQPLSVSYPAFVYGAAISWNVNNNKDINIPQQVSRYVFSDKTGISGEVVVNLGNAYLKTGVLTDNSNIFHQLLQRNKYSVKTDKWLKRINYSNITNARNYIESEINRLTKASLQCTDSDIVITELKQACDLAIHACRLAQAKLNTADGHFKSINAAKKKELITELQKLVEKHREIWLLRNRPGGLNDSAERMKRILH